MVYACDYCGKGIQTGRNIRHKRGVAGGRWKRKAQRTPRQWLPNIHSVRVVEEGKVVRRRLCTKCLRRAERPKPKMKEEPKEIGKKEKIEVKREEKKVKKEKGKKEKEK
jgi:large subunit ribosomal protein L28